MVCEWLLLSSLWFDAVLLFKVLFVYGFGGDTLVLNFYYVVGDGMVVVWFVCLILCVYCGEVDLVLL